MSAKFKKTMLRVGHTYKAPDGEVAVTADRLKHWATEHKRLAEAGYIPPMHYDHSDELEMLEPIAMDSFEKKSSRSAKNSVGFLSEFNLTDDGQAAELVYSVTDDKAAKQLEDNVVQVSPVIFKKFRDGAGNEYSDLITHLDVVNYAVDYSQSPSERINDTPVVMAIRMGLSEPYKYSPDQPSPSMGDIMKGLQQVGVTLPPDTTSENFLERLHVALVAANAVNPLVEDGVDPGSNTFDQSGETIVANPQIAAMSLQKYADNQYRENQQAKLDALLANGQMTPAEHKDQETKLNAIKLSLTDDGKPTSNSVSEFIANREAVPKGTFWTDEQKLAADQTVDQPEATKMSSNPEGQNKEPSFEDDYSVAQDILGG